MVMVLAAVVCQGFGCNNSIRSSVKTNDSSLPQWLERIDRGQMADWIGWKPEWKLSDVDAVLERAGAPQGYELGGRALQLVQFSLAHQSMPLQVMADSAGHVVMVRLEDAVLDQSAAALEQHWGVPKAKGNLPSDHLFAPAALWAYPDRGITLYVMNPSTQGAMSLSAISLYPRTSLEHFLHELDGDERVRMWDK